MGKSPKIGPVPHPRVSNFGRIHCIKGHKYFPKPKPDGYSVFNVNGALVRVHRLVHILFNDPDLSGFVPGESVDHIDRDRSHNHFKNLQWASCEQQRENQLRRIGKSQTALRSAAKGRVDVVLEGEKWRRFPGGAEVSNRGRFKAANSNKRYFPTASRSGYVRVGIDGGVWLLHRLVLKAFGPSRPPDWQNMVVDHIDRDKSNNDIDNLQWATKSQNCQNRSNTATSHQRAIECRSAGSGSWVRFSSAKEASIVIGVDAKTVRNVANPRSPTTSCLGNGGVRYECRHAAGEDEDIHGEQWKTVYSKDWCAGGRYAGLC